MPVAQARFHRRGFPAQGAVPRPGRRRPDRRIAAHGGAAGVSATAPAAAGAEPAWIEDVLGFWFGLPHACWWHKDAAFDALVRERFLALHELLCAEPTQAMD